MGTKDSDNDQTALAAFNAAFGEDDDGTDAESAFAQQGHQADAGSRARAGGDATQVQAGGQADSGEKVDELPADPVARMMALEERILQLAQANAELNHKVNSATGRVSAMQREMETSRRRAPAPAPQAQAQTPAPPAPRLDKFEAVRSELPDVADGLAQYVDAQLEKIRPTAQPEPQEQEVTTSSHGGSSEAALYEAFPQWEQTVTRPEFDLWLRAKGDEYTKRIKSTGDAAEMMGALVQYQAHVNQATRQPQPDVNHTRALRAQQAVLPNTPAGRSARTPSQSAEQAFSEGFANER